MKGKNKMKLWIRFPDVRDAAQGVSWNYSRIFKSLRNSNMIFLYSIWAGLLVLFVLDSQIVERIGVIASALIAGIVCWLHYENYIKDTEKKRKKEMFSSCEVFSENLRLNSKKDVNGNISLDFMGQKGQIVTTYSGDKRRIEWKFDYVALTGECMLDMIERSISVEGEKNGRFKMIEYRATKFGSSIKSYAGWFSYKTGKVQSKDSKSFHEYNRDEWELFVANISGTMFKYFQSIITSQLKR